jgi:hypothetical protein
MNNKNKKHQEAIKNFAKKNKIIKDNKLVKKD